jgi:hypothetical protein
MVLPPGARQSLGIPMGAFSSNGSQSSRYEEVPEGYDRFVLENYTPEQMKLFGQQFSQVDPGGYLSKLASGNEGVFQDIEKPALQQFNALQGNIASRFSGAGMGARNSSGFQNSINAASQDFAGQLQSNRQQMRRQAILDLMGLSNQILGQKPYETGLAEIPQQEQGKALGGWGGAIGTAGGAAIGTYLGNPLLGAKMGYAAGTAIDQ